MSWSRGDPAEVRISPAARLRVAAKTTWWQRLPVTLKVGLPLVLLLAAGLELKRIFLDVRVRLRVLDTAGVAVPRALLEFFPLAEGPHEPSPPDLLGRLPWDLQSPPEIGRALLGQEGLVRASAPGLGIDFAFAAADGQVHDLVLGPPRDLEGQVRDGSLLPARGARVVAFGGGQRGVPLVEAVTDAEGRFRLQGMSGRHDRVWVRVLHAGHAIAEQNRFYADEAELRFDLLPTRPVQGRLEFPAQVDPAGLRVLAYKVPGVSAQVGPDGRFVLDHLPPPPTTVRLLVHGLPLGWTHRLTVVSPGDDGVVLVVQRGATVSGSVVEDGSNRLVPHAMVMHGHGPRGQVMVHADQYGRFQLADLPQGMVEIEAYVPARPPERILVTESAPALRPPRTGVLRLELKDGAGASGVMVPVR